MQEWDAVVFDTETTGLEPYLGDYPIGIGLSPMAEEKYYYLPLEGLNSLDLRPILEPMEHKPLIGHNIKFDLHMLATQDWQGQQDYFYDTIVLTRLWAKEERPSLDLKNLGLQIFDYHYEDEAVVRAAKAGKLDTISVERAGHYCCEDVWLTKKLYKWLKEQLPESLLKLFVRESYLTRDLFDIERLGVQIDQEYLETAVSKLDSELCKLLISIQQSTGLEDFNARSPLQISQLMESLKIKPVAQTPKGKASWDRDACLAVRHQHSVALQLAKYRALAYQRSGLVERARQAVRRSGGVLHGTFNNWGTITGRLNSNMQQMPKGWLQLETESEMGEDVLVWAEGPEQDFSIRRLLRPRPGKVMIKADYRQIEMFVLGSYMKDSTFNAWLDSGNVHAACALEIWGDGEKYYERGKVYNFATVYGQGDKARAASLGCSLLDSQHYREDYEQRMPGYRKFINKVRHLLRRDGFVSNIYGRQYWLGEDLAYKGVNYLCQGSAGDFVKFKLPETRKLRQQIGIDVLITTHDDFVVELPIEEVKRLPEWLKELTKSPFGRPLELDPEYSYDSLVQLHPLEELIHAS